MSVILVMGYITCDDNYVIEIIETIVSANEKKKNSAEHIYGRIKNKSQLHCMHAKIETLSLLLDKVLQKLFITNDKLNKMHIAHEIARNAEMR